MKRRQHWWACQSCGEFTATRQGDHPPHRRCEVCSDTACDFKYVGFCLNPFCPNPKPVKKKIGQLKSDAEIKRWAKSLAGKKEIRAALELANNAISVMAEEERRWRREIWPKIKHLPFDI